MKFLCNVHIPLKLVTYLNSFGFEAIHVNMILNKWFTSDNDINKFADENDFIVITKDSDFRNSFYIQKSPKKLIKINLGNISNTELINIISNHLEHIKLLEKHASFIIEIDKKSTQYNILNNDI